MHLNRWLFWTCVGIAIIEMIFIYCFHKHLRRVPYNYIVLFSFTALMSYITGFISTVYSNYTVLCGGVFTIVLVIALTLYACYASEIRILWGTLLVLCVSMFPLIIFLVIAPNRFLIYLLCILLCVILSIFIIYDTNAIVNHKRWGLDYDDYVFAVIILYLDIVQLFLEVLRAMGSGNNNN